MPRFICKTCGVQYADADAPPGVCRICDDERQYIGWNGQQWTTLEEMRAGEYRNEVRETDPGVWSIITRPHFCIGQRALLVQTDGGNFLWDCISYLDDPTIARVNELGGVQGISVSHPHFYATVGEWSEAFGAPIYLPEADREYFVRTDAEVQWYTGVVEAWPGTTVVQVGGHFDGSGVLHWAGGAGGKGALFTGDSIAVAQDRDWVTFMRSFPNYIPLPPAAIHRILDALAPYDFDRLYGGWWGTDVSADARAAVTRSAERYIRWTGGERP